MTQDQPRMSSFAVFRLLLPLYLVVAVGPLNTVGTFNLIPVFSEDFGVSLSLAGLAVTIYMLAITVILRPAKREPHEATVSQDTGKHSVD